MERELKLIPPPQLVSLQFFYLLHSFAYPHQINLKITDRSRAKIGNRIKRDRIKMENKGLHNAKEKRLKRKELVYEASLCVAEAYQDNTSRVFFRKFMKDVIVLEKKKAIVEIIRKATSVQDHLTSFLPFCQYNRNGLSVHLESGNGDHLSSPTKKYIQNLLKVNMERYYGLEWPTEEKVKRREMVVPEARYIFVRQSNTNATIAGVNKPEDGSDDGGLMDGQDRLVGFVHYRFVVEEDVPVAYVYELQLESCAQGKGLAKFLMQLVELIACKNKMGAVVLTVQKANENAMSFYTNKLRYVISSISPSCVDPLIGAEKSYEILCKTFNPEAKSKLEE